MMLKRLLSIFIVFTLIFQIVVFAEEDLSNNDEEIKKVFVQDDFEKYEDGSMLFKGAAWSLVKNAGNYGRLIIKKDQTGHFLSGEMFAGSSRDIYFGKNNFNMEADANIRFRFKAVQGKEMDFSLVTEGFIRMSILRFYKGKVYFMGGREVASYHQNEWNDIFISFEADKAKLILNGTTYYSPMIYGMRTLSSLYFITKNHGASLQVHFDDILIHHFEPTIVEEVVEEVRDVNYDIIMRKLGRYQAAFLDGSPRVFTGDGVEMYVADDYSICAYTDEKGMLMIPFDWVEKRFQIKATDSELITKNDVTYISIERIAKKMNTFYYYDEKYGQWIHGTKVDPFSADEAVIKRELYRRLKYTRPSGKQILEDMNNHLMNTASYVSDDADGAQTASDSMHPRIFVRESDFQRISQLIVTDPIAKEWFEKIKKEVDIFVEEKTSWDSVNMHKMVNTALIFRLTGDGKYGDKIWNILQLGGEDESDWKLSNTVSTGNYTYIYSVCYDWCYDYFSQSQREAIANIVFEKALNFADAVYRGLPSGDMVNWWPNCEHNWNFVCNGAFALAALTFTEYDEQMCERILTHAIKGLESAIDSFGKNGGWMEGPGYWQYGVQYLFWIIEALVSTTGTDYGYMTYQIANSPLFPVHLTTNNGAFNFHDSTPGAIPHPTQLMFSAHFTGNGMYARVLLDYMKRYKTAPMASDLLFYDPDIIPKKADLALDEYYDVVETVSFRSNWDDPYGVFVGLHGGQVNVNHGDCDSGTFVLDALGERYFVDLGMDSYSLPGYHSRSVGGARWQYYRKRAEGSNTLVINPSMEADQDPASFSPITKYVSAPSGGYAVVDLTAAYAGAKSIRRGIMFYDNRSKVLIQDEISMTKPSKLYWFGHTFSEITIEAGGKTAILNSSGKKLQATILSPQNASFSVMNAEPLPTSPQVKQSDNPSVRKLTVEMDAVTDVRLSIAFIPLMDGQITDDLPEVSSLDKWYISGEELPDTGLVGITAAGKALEDFNINRYNYICNVYSLKEDTMVVEPIVGENKGYSFNVINPLSVYEPAVIEVSDARGEIINRYYVYFDKIGLPIAAVEASSEPEPENVKENVLDGSSLTRWSSNGTDEWIMLELEEEANINELAIAWYRGNERKTKFEIEVSADKKNWKQVYSGESSGKSSYKEKYGFKTENCKYVRIRLHGNNVNQWNSILTVDVYTE